MTMTPGLRKVTLTTHITSSVGWVGEVIAFLALASNSRLTYSAFGPASPRPES